jgi:hypothetical protein
MVPNMRIDAFSKLGEKIGSLSMAEKEALFRTAANENAWFTAANVGLAFEGIQRLLDRTSLVRWASAYDLERPIPKSVGVVMAGNIPMVGFHDMLCVLISGHRLRAKLSSQDSVLMKFLIHELCKIEPAIKEFVSIEERLNGVDAVIATGSDNTSRYFEYYFRNIPHIIRKNRSSCAVLVGEEPIEELEQLGRDIFSYFGLGCRNVSKIFVPEDFDFDKLPPAWVGYSPIVQHHKYANNYDYNKSVYLINQVPFFDTGYLLITESEALVSPISVLYYEKYKSQKELHNRLSEHQEKIQCIVSAKGWFEKSVSMGSAQLPNVDDYADNADTLRFLTTL